MKEQIMDEVLARQFLLGQLSLEEQGRIEELAFTDPQTFTFLQAAEDDLIDEFVYDDLSDDERQRFEEHFLAQPGRRKDLRIARALRHSFEREPVAPPPSPSPLPSLSLWERVRQWFRVSSTDLKPAIVTAALIIAAIIGLVFLVRALLGQRSGPPVQVQQQQTPALPTPTTTASETPAPASPSPAHRDNDNKAPQPPQRPVYVMLLPGGPTRSGGDETAVSRSSAAVVVHLPLVSLASYRSYEATLELDGKVLKTWANLRPTRSGEVKVIRVSVPSELLQVSQRYKFALNGVGPNGDVKHVENYYFRVTN